MPSRHPTVSLSSFLQLIIKVQTIEGEGQGQALGQVDKNVSIQLEGDFRKFYVNTIRLISEISQIVLQTCRSILHTEDMCWCPHFKKNIYRSPHQYPHSSKMHYIVYIQWKPSKYVYDAIYIRTHQQGDDVFRITGNGKP